MRKVLPRQKFVSFYLSNKHGGEGWLCGFERFSGCVGGKRLTGIIRKTREEIEQIYGEIEAQLIDTKFGRVYVFTADLVIFVNDYDGFETLCGIPRNPDPKHCW